MLPKVEHTPRNPSPSSSRSVFGFASRVDTNVTLVATLGIAAAQESGYTTLPWLSVLLWVVVFCLLMELVWNKPNVDKLTTCSLTLVYLAVVGVLAYRAVVGPAIPQATVQVSFQDDLKIPAVPVKLIDGKPDFSGLILGYPSLPIYNFIFHPGAQKGLNVRIKNLSSFPIHDPRIQIGSNVPIEGKTVGTLPFSDYMVGFEPRELVPFRRTRNVQDVSINFKDAQPGLVQVWVLIDADNMKPYAGLIELRMVPQP